MAIAYVLARTTNNHSSVCIISTKISVVKNRKKELESRQVQVAGLRKKLALVKLEYAKQWNRQSELATTLEELNERDDNMWSWVNEQLDIYTQFLKIPTNLVAASNLSLPFTEYTYEIQSAEMI